MTPPSRCLESARAVAKYKSLEEHVVAEYRPSSTWLCWLVVSLFSATFYIDTALFTGFVLLWGRVLLFDANSFMAMEISWDGLLLVSVIYSAFLTVLMRSRWLPYCNGKSLGLLAYGFFNTRVVVSQAEFSGCPGPYVIACAPHGIVPLHNVLALAFFARFLPGLKHRLAVATVAYHLPIVRQVAYSIGSLPATPARMLRALRAGSSVSLVPGGIAELFMSDTAVERVCASHKGFVRIAMRAGTPIVPVYVFGATRMFRQLGSHSGLATVLSRLLKASLTLYYGQFGLPIPFPTRVTIVVGRPIPTGAPTEHPDKADVDRLHTAYLSALQEMYHTHKDEAGYGNTPFELVHI